MLVIEYRLLIIIFFSLLLSFRLFSTSLTHVPTSTFRFTSTLMPRVGSRILHSRPSQVIPRSFLILAEKTITSSASLRIAAHSRSAAQLSWHTYSVLLSFSRKATRPGFRPISLWCLYLRSNDKYFAWALPKD
jgi:hypothetical protein